MATIVVVDDQPANREFLVTLLGYMGHTLLEAADGQQALEVVRRTQPDLVIADLVMPTMDGYEFVHQLRAEPAIAQTAVVFCTATYQQAEAWELARRCGVEHIITKPAEPEVVLRTVAAVLGRVAPRPRALAVEEFQRAHLRVLTDKLFKQVQALEREVAQRTELERVVQQERDLLEVTLSSLGEAVLATDAAGCLTFLNPVAEALTGWTTDEARGRAVEEILPLYQEQSRQPLRSPVRHVLGQGGAVAEPAVLVARDGRAIPIAESGAPIRDKRGQVQGVVVVFRDTTERKQSEAALIRAKEAAEAADRLKSEFLATMSHELRTPLNVILGYVELLVEGGFGAVTAAQGAVLRRLEQNTRVLCELISMVLDLNRLEAGRLPLDVKGVELGALLEEIRAEMQGLCEQSGLSFRWQVEAALPVVQTDPGKLKVIVKNLVGNAIKFTPRGRVTVRAQAQPAGVEIGVSDTGIGIAPEAQALIFEPFRQVDSAATRRYAGSGLGLHIVKRLLEVLGGTVSVQSALGHGSTFRVWLPRNREANV
jgi:PAS domain S-box-containing protein